MRSGLRLLKRCHFGASFCTKRKLFSVLLSVVILLTLSACRNEAAMPSEDMPETQQAAKSEGSGLAEETPKEMPVIEVSPASDDAGEDATGKKEWDDPEEAFYITEIGDELFERMRGLSFKEDCTLPREDLRYLHVLHKTADGNTMEGELVVNVHIADTVLEIFRELYEMDYPIEKIRLIDEYDADDERSMADNNTSCFNFRLVSDTNTVSRHGMGLAIDLNPFYNPYVRTKDGQTIVEPAGSDPYADRTKDFPYKIDTEDPAYRLFTKKGFIWGGLWKNSKDYQHFEIPKEQIKTWYPDS